MGWLLPHRSSARRDADGNQGVHIGLAMFERLPHTGKEVTACPDHHREGQHSKQSPYDAACIASRCEPFAEYWHELRVREDDDGERDDGRKPEFAEQCSVFLGLILLGAIHSRLSRSSRLCLLRQTQRQQTVEGEGRITQLGIAVIPVASAANMLRQAGRWGSHQRARRCIRQEFEDQR